MRDAISRQDAVMAIEAESVSGETKTEGDFAYNVALRDALAAINALPAVECKQCSELVHEINGYKDVLAQAEGIIADLRADAG